MTEPQESFFTKWSRVIKSVKMTPRTTTFAECQSCGNISRIVRGICDTCCEPYDRNGEEATR